MEDPPLVNNTKRITERRMFIYYLIFLLVLALSIALCGFLIYRPRHALARFENAESVKQYLLTKLVIGKSTIAQVKGVIKQEISDDELCSKPNDGIRDNYMHLTCAVIYAESILGDSYYDFDLSFENDVLIDVKVTFGCVCL